MKVLSLFDGISCGRVALERAGIPVEEYYASEIDKYAIQISQKNYPDIIRLGDVKNVNGKDFENIDLLIAGFPCQSFSIAGKRRGLEDERGKLVYDLIRILKEVKPKHIILENVASMKKEIQEYLREEFEKATGRKVYINKINASLVSAQNRNRIFFCFQEIPQPEDRGILLKDILEDNVDDKYFVKLSDRYGLKGLVFDKSKALTASMWKGYGNDGVSIFAVNPFSKQILGNKSRALNTVCHSPTTKNATVLFSENKYRKLTPVECERLQSLPEIEKYCIINVCLDHQNNYVNAENKNLKSQSVVGNVEKKDLKENVLSAKKNLNTKNLPINKPVQPDVLISCGENTLQIHYQGKLLASVSGAEWKQNVHHLKRIEDFVHLIVGLNTIVEKTIKGGGVELHQKNNISIAVEDGNNVVNLYGKGIMQLAKDVEKDLTTLNKLLKSTISGLSIQENNEQIIQTLFSFVVLVIFGYIPKEIQNQNILTFQIKSKVGYTWGISDTQRYKQCGNGFNADVITHIIKELK